MISISKPFLTLKEINAVKKVLKSGIIASGPKVKEFESKFSKYLGVKNAVAVANALPEARQHAHEVIGSNEEDAVVRYLATQWRNKKPAKEHNA